MSKLSERPEALDVSKRSSQVNPIVQAKFHLFEFHLFHVVWAANEAVNWLLICEQEATRQALSASFGVNGIHLIRIVASFMSTVQFVV